MSFDIVTFLAILAYVGAAIGCFARLTQLTDRALSMRLLGAVAWPFGLGALVVDGNLGVQRELKEQEMSRRYAHCPHGFTDWDLCPDCCH